MTEDVLHPNGLYNPLIRFAVTNITDEDLVSYWDGRPFTIKAHDTVKLPHHLTVKVVRELVDKIMMGEAKLDEVRFYKENPNAAANTYRSPKGMGLGVPAQRKVWEDKIAKQLEDEKDSIQMEILRAETIQKLSSDLNAKPSTEAPAFAPQSEFAEISKK